MAGPDRPPLIRPSFDRRVWMSTAMPGMVLIRLKASEPASSTARAISPISDTWGLSLVIRGQPGGCPNPGHDFGRRLGIDPER